MILDLVEQIVLANEIEDVRFSELEEIRERFPWLPILDVSVWERSATVLGPPEENGQFGEAFHQNRFGRFSFQLIFDRDDHDGNIVDVA